MNLHADECERDRVQTDEIDVEKERANERIIEQATQRATCV